MGEGLSGLDAGSGDFYWTPIISESLSKVISIDLVRPPISDNIFRFNFVQGSIDHLPFADSSFDFICSISSIQYIVDQNKTFEEFYRVLKPGGRLLMTVPAAFSPFRLVRRLEIKFKAYPFQRFQTEVYHYYSRQTINKLISHRFTLLEHHGLMYFFLPRYAIFLAHVLIKQRAFRFTKRGPAKSSRQGGAVPAKRYSSLIVEYVHRFAGPEADVPKGRESAIARVFKFLTELSWHHIVVLRKE